MSFIEEFLLPNDIPSRLASILLMLCIILLCIKKRSYDLIAGLFIVAWFLCLLSIIDGIILSFDFLDLVAFRFECLYQMLVAFYSSLVPTMVLTVAIAGILFKRGGLQFMKQYKWFILFIMIAFIDVILVWYLAANYFQ